MIAEGTKNNNAITTTKKTTATQERCTISWNTIANSCRFDGCCLKKKTQIDASLDSYIKPDVYEQIPAEPANMIKTGKEVFLVSKQEGRIARVPGVDVIRSLPSFRYKLSRISKTLDNKQHQTKQNKKYSKF